jgi:hypothetical protein
MNRSDIMTLTIYDLHTLIGVNNRYVNQRNAYLQETNKELYKENKY